MSKKYIFKLKDVANITMGQSPKSEYYNQEGEGTPFLQGNSTFGDKYPKIEKYTTKETRISNKNEVLMSVRAPVGDININPFEKICVGRGLCSIQLHNNQNEYLYYFLKANQRKIQNKGTGTVFSAINKSDVENIEIYIPDEIQIENITKKLKVLDDKIENNNAIIANLEEQAQAIFKSWFINFEPFQDEEFIDTELGLIPESFNVATFDDFVSISSGKRKKNSEKTADNIYPIIGASKITGYTDDYLFNEKVIITGRVGTLGTSQIYNSKIWPSDNTLILRSDFYAFTYFALKTINFSALNRGSTQPLVSQKDIKNSKVILPNMEWLSKFENILNPIINYYWKIEEENQKLIEIRDTLLPKLMSGEIRVEEAVEVR